MRTAWGLCAVALLCVGSGSARAQDAQASEAPLPEGPDPTRLDVERLPPEAIEVTRELYAHGLFVEGGIGVRTFRGGVGSVSAPGLYAHVGVGLELLPFLWVRAAVEGSIHGTDAPPPPSPTVFEVIGALGELRLQGNFTSRFAMWLGADVGIAYATGEVLRVYGFEQSSDIGLLYGGTVGLDWHMVNRHHSIGLSGGARIFQKLDLPGGSAAIGIHGSAYMRYVF